jgi:putative DNA primase/helicase
MIPPHILDRARGVSIAEAAHLLGLRLPRVGEHEGPCPACGGRDRFSINSRKGVWNCRGAGGGNDAISLVKHVRGVDFKGAVELLAGERDLPPAPQPRPAPQSDDDDVTKITRARLIAREGQDARQTVAEVYLAIARKLGAIDAGAAQSLRFHARLPVKNPDDELVRVPALVALMRDVRATFDMLARERGTVAEAEAAVLRDESLIKAVSCLALSDDGRAKRFGPKSRKFRGVAKGAGVILGDMWSLYYGGGELHVAEGVETALAVRKLFGAELVVALGSAGAIRDFECLPCVQRLVIHAERDENGASERAAFECFARWREHIRNVEIVAPRAVNDANDVLMQEAGE